MLGLKENCCRIIFMLLAKRHCGKVGKGTKINHKCSFTHKTLIGENCHFNGMRITGNGNVSIGDNLHSGRDIIIITSDHNYDKGDAVPYDSSFISGNVIIDNNVWLGDRVIILKGVHIGEGAIIQAGSVVVNDIPPMSIAGGHPAKVFKMRDIEHYLHCKDNNLFF